MMTYILYKQEEVGTMSIKNTKYEILTPTGFRDFDGIRKVVHQKYIQIKTTRGFELKCSVDHKIQIDGGFKEAGQLNIGDFIHTKHGKEKIEFIGCIDDEVELYDPLEVSNGNVFFSNSIVSHNCSFLGSAYTLIETEKLRNMVWKQHVRQFENGLDVLEEPAEGGMYIMNVDVSRGIEGDYSAFTIIRIDEFPYRLVAKFKSNTIQPMLFPNVIDTVGRKYNTAHVLIEVNDIGGQVADILFYEMEYDNIVQVMFKGRAGQKLSSWGGKGSQMGVKMSEKVKRIGCSNLKTLIESDKLLVEDEDVIEELTTFVQKKLSYEAEDGCHDDLAMCLVQFAWMSAQNYFTDMTDRDIRKHIEKEKEKDLLEEMLPFFSVNDGTTEETFVDSEGTVWHVDSDDENWIM
jgi:hypothetical protein